MIGRSATKFLRMHPVVVGDETAAEKGLATAAGGVARDGVVRDDGLSARGFVGTCNDTAKDERTPDGAAVFDIADVVMVGAEKRLRKIDQDAWSSAVSEL